MASANLTMDHRNPQAAALVERGVKFLDKGKPANALRAFDDAIAIDAENPEAFCHRGNALADLGQWDQAIANYDRAIALNPRLAEAHDFRGVAFAQIGQIDEALRSVARALTIAPDNFNALNNRANLLRDIGRLEEALVAFDIVIQREPAFPVAHSMRAQTLAGLGRHEEALLGFDRVLALEPRNVEALCNRGTALIFLGRPAEGIEALRHILTIDPNHVETIANLGDALASQQHYDEAESCFRRCVELQPTFIEASISLGLLLSLQRRFDEAGRTYQAILKIDLNNQRALHGLARAMEEFGQYQSALTCYDHLLSFAPDDAFAHRKRGQALLYLSQQEEAIRSIDRATALDQNQMLPSTRLHAAMHLSQWERFDEQLEDVRNAVEAGFSDTMPFPILALVDDPALQFESSRTLARHHGLAPTSPIVARYPRREKIRLGYFSADFHHHATMQLLAETLEAHDHDRFELCAFAFGTGREDIWQKRAEDAFDQFVDVRLKDDRKVAEIAREMEIDIAIDLKGYTHNCRFGIFVERAAPIQVGYLGYPGTSGSSCIDYFIADREIIHPKGRPYISEKIVYLPGSYQANAALHPISSDATREGVGLPKQAFVFCCFNQNYKITPDVFGIWMRILRQVKGSVLWIWVDRETARQNLLREAEAAGISRERIIFANAEPLDKHFDRLQLADLFLDTFPCNAHTTASDALRSGLPILTCAGQTFASRAAASLLQAVNLPEMIVDNFRDYEALAIRLGQDKAKLQEIKTRLAANRATSTLFDPRAMAHKLEAAYTQMYERYQEGLEPDDIHIAL